MIEAKAFRYAFPDLFLELTFVPATPAEKVADKAVMNELVTYISRESYVITSSQELPDTS
jgi:hypothetical protein